MMSIRAYLQTHLEYFPTLPLPLMAMGYHGPAGLECAFLGPVFGSSGPGPVFTFSLLDSGVLVHDDYELGSGWQRSGPLSWLLFFLCPLIRLPPAATWRNSLALSSSSSSSSSSCLFLFSLSLLLVPSLLPCAFISCVLNVGRMFEG
jgi:hypothetical protein